MLSTWSVCVQYLSGADPVIWDKEKLIPLTVAAQHNNVEVAEILLEGFEKPAKQLLFKDRCARLPIHHAVKVSVLNVVWFTCSLVSV